MKELVKEGVVDGVKSLGEVNGEEGGTEEGFRVIEGFNDGLSDFKHGSTERDI